MGRLRPDVTPQAVVALRLAADDMPISRPGQPWAGAADWLRRRARAFEVALRDADGSQSPAGPADIVEWGVRSDAGGNGAANYGPYSTREYAEEVRDRLVESGGRLITRRVTEWAEVVTPSGAEGTDG